MVLVNPFTSPLFQLHPFFLPVSPHSESGENSPTMTTTPKRSPTPRLPCILASRVPPRAAETAAGCPLSSAGTVTAGGCTHAASARTPRPTRTWWPSTCGATRGRSRTAATSAHAASPTARTCRATCASTRGRSGWCARCAVRALSPSSS